jgi:hypothetical protein
MPQAMLAHEAMVALLGLAGRCCPDSIETAELVCQVHFSAALVRAEEALLARHERGASGLGLDRERRDVRECHVEGDLHRGDVASGLGQQVTALQGGHQPGGQDFGIGVPP